MSRHIGLSMASRWLWALHRMMRTRFQSSLEVAGVGKELSSSSWKAEEDGSSDVVALIIIRVAFHGAFLLFLLGLASARLVDVLLLVPDTLSSGCLGALG